MKKKLNARTQKLIKTLPTLSKSFAGSVTIEPDEEDLLEKRGVIYSIFDLTTYTEIDPLLVSKIVHDVLFDSYYASETTSPIQSLERAIVNVRDKVTKLSEATGNVEFTPTFNMLAAALWGNVLYMVQFGKGGSYLVRDNTLKPVNSATEGSFSVASGVVKDDDVVILGTKTFFEKYTAQDLISESVSFSMHNLPDTAAAFLLKFDVVSEFTEEETIDFNLGENSDKKDPKEKDFPIATTSKSKSYKTKLFSTMPKISLTKVIGQGVNWYYVGIIILIVGLGLSIFTTFKNKQKNNQDTNGGAATSNDSANKDSEVKPLSPEEIVAKQLEEDTKNKTSRVEAKFFYDLKLVDEGANPNDIVVLDSAVVVSDKSSGKVFFSSNVTPKFTEEFNASGVSNLNYFGGDLSFTDGEGYKIYDLTKKTITEKYVGKLSSVAAPYLAFLYGVKDNTIQKYQLLDTGLVGAEWATSDEFNGVTSIAIDGSIYVLKTDSITKYLSGEKTDFSLDALAQKLNGANKVIKDIDLDKVYVSDAGNKRILVLDENGGLIKQILAKGDEFNDIKSISVSRDEKILYVLSGSKVYEVGM
ncbi:hypothetical protein HYV31_02895 [candidate division WWE3 bacterium]|nr:hypothetical protein [candidate division WWE3 bacterium]